MTSPAISRFQGSMPPLTHARAAAEALTLLDALARAPAAAALVVAALNTQERKALRLVHTQLRDAVGEATTKLEVIAHGEGGAARPPTPAHWPRLKELRVSGPDSAALEALGVGTWDRLRALSIGDRRTQTQSPLDEPRAARARVGK